MSFEAEERIEILDSSACGWWTGRKIETGEMGWCPSTYVEVVNINGFEDIVTDALETIDVESEEIYVRVVAPYDGDTGNVLTLVTGQIIQVFEQDHESGWWKGCVENQDPGWFPCTYVEYLDMVVIEDYQGINVEEKVHVLTLYRGESLTVLQRHVSGWSQGQKIETGEIGWYPSDYAEYWHSDLDARERSEEEDEVYTIADDDVFLEQVNQETKDIHFYIILIDQQH